MSSYVKAIVSSDDNGEFLPAVGEQAQRVLSGLPEEAQLSIREESLRVLARCGSARDEWSAAQLVVGEVQSGKTLSFTTVMALARDNDYPLIVVLAGTKNNLLTQTEKRLKRDLNVYGDGGLNPWRTWTNPTAADTDSLLRLLQEWSDPAFSADERQTAVLFVLKHAGRLDALTNLLNEVFDKRMARPVRALVIDDEADQASLNIKAAKGQESTVYAAVQGMRAALARHVYLMYTATPQAPLLISIADALSPEKVTMLAAGHDYVGGADLFADQSSQFVRQITEQDMVAALDPSAEAAPRSLADALAFWALALVVAQRRNGPRPLAMLVHPASTKDLHKKYDEWVKAILDDWREVLRDEDDVAYGELLDDTFVPAYEDLARTVPELPSYQEEPTHLRSMLSTARVYLNRVEQRVVNSETAAEIPEEEWKTFPGWIVIGGNKLDRGFTVQSLAVTYMPRGPGVGNADTIQQRGRFFGYKRPYLDLLRGWFSADLARIFKQYVEHEHSMQAQLREVDQKGSSLKEWRRKLLLDPDLRPTRQQVITLSSETAVVGKSKFPFRQEDLYFEGLATDNAGLLTEVSKLLERLGSPDQRDQRPGPEHGRHHIAPWNYAEAMQLIEAWACSPVEREQLDRLLFLIAAVQDGVVDKPLQVVVMGMDNLEPRNRSRSVSNSLSISRLFQGRASTQDRYPGDEAFREPTAITVQVHMVDPQGSGTGPVPALAVGIPDGWERRVYWELPR
ncbi:Z1 domain-containing protein [Actinoplanes awajinensis]|uniref:Putative endonuclease Z1 domain-containing protein n=1 Tax=Actinoplanes awajinensis subsp. mycoplanecinus TaxID=135947 RepID=A0A101JQP7_9ACTN|nr:Z1 domain-containing protein [Actinoplanes awajinensis]KUL31260.1 hypothetical protein ADL15_22690 [Actinoplanes awajinensis subsp. mycoplanecinus]